MVGSDILLSARNNLNAATSTFWSDAELLQKLYEVMLEVAHETLCIEAVSSSTTTVAGTADYAKPTRAIEVWRVTFNGAKLQRIDYRQYDSINPNSLTVTGRPYYYLYYNDTVTCYPTPSDAQTLKMWSYNEPAVPTTSSTLEIPTTGHHVLVAGTTYKMCPKDLGNPLTLFWKTEYEQLKEEFKAFIARRRRSDRFAVVKCEENSVYSDFGFV